MSAGTHATRQQSTWPIPRTAARRYPVMFMSYLDVLVPVLKGSWLRT